MIFWNRKKKDIMLMPAQKLVLDKVQEIMKENSLYVSREQLDLKLHPQERTYDGPFIAFDMMEALHKIGVLERQGWNFTISQKGYEYLKNHSEFAEEISNFCC